VFQLSVKKGKARGRRSDRDADDHVEKAHQFADLSGYPLKKRLMIHGADLAFYGLINLIGRTVRFKVEGWEHWESASRDGRIPVGAFWHGGIFLTTYFWRRRDIVVMTSQSFDGEYIARFIQRFGYGAVRGSSTRGSVGAIVEMIRLMRLGQTTAFTIDGPKGPRHVAKMGAVLLAKKTGHPILPFTVIPASYWSLNRSWDAMRIPRPFTTARVEIAAPIFVPPNANEAVLEARRGELQEALDKLECRGQQWRAAGSVSV
jgi:lysophospholipid acyltransferase (LPLAT)-like uncharacterized protein